MNENDRKIFYAALFLSGKPIDIKQLRKIINPFNIENSLIEFAQEFNSYNLGIKIRTVMGGFQMVVNDDVSNELKVYFGEKQEALSKSAMETLSIVAYKQPATKAEIEKIRGVDSSGSMKTLLDKNLIKTAGRKNIPGRPLLYVTTQYFLEYFGLNSIEELPTFREWQDLKKK